MSFKDHFSTTAELYAAHRPSYPAGLFSWLAAAAPRRGRVWDCGTGSGQAATALAAYFHDVVATDPSYAQLIHARRHPDVHYAAMTAEASALSDASVQLVTVAQAIHWFDRKRFYPEVRRILVPRGVIAVWAYGLLRVDPSMDRLIHEFYTAKLDTYWPPERTLIDAGLATLDFPFHEIGVPPFVMKVKWTLYQLAGYISTWSAVNRYIAVRGEDPVPAFVDALRPLWGSALQAREIHWPLEVRAGVTSSA